MPRRALLAIVPLLLAVVACNRDPQVQSQKLVENGNKFYDRAKFREASIMYRRALTKNPKNGDAYYRLGLASIKLQAWDEAVKSFRRTLDIAAEQHRDNPDAATKLADIYWMAYVATTIQPNAGKGGNSQLLPEIEELSKGLLKRDPKSFDGLRLSGYLALSQARVAETSHDVEGAKAAMAKALGQFEAANSVKPYDPQLCMALVNSLLAAGRGDEGEKLAREVIARQKSFLPMYDILLRMYVGSNRLAEAEGLLQDKVRNNPTQDGPRLQLAAFYFDSKRRPESEKVLQDMISDTKDFPMAHLRVGQFFTRTGDFERARREYEAGISATPKQKAEYQKALVALLSALGKNQEAAAIVDDILKADPKDSVALELRSALSIQSGDPAKIDTAVTDLQGLVAKNSTNAPLRFELGRALVAKNLPDQALTHLQEALRLRPGFVQAKIILAQIYSQKHDNTRALQYADEVISVDSRNLAARLIRTAALMGLGDKDKAKEELEAMSKARPDSNDVRYQLGYLNFSEGNFKQAEQVFQQLRETAPSDVRGVVGIVESEVAMKNYPVAIQLVEAELQKDPNRQDFRLALATVLARAGQNDEAIKQFQILLAKNPKSADYELKLGETYRLKGDVNNAIDHFRRASTLAPTNAVPLIRVAMLLDGLGRRAEARPLYEQVVRLQPDNAIALNNLAFAKAEEGTDLDQALSYAQRAKRLVPQDANISDTLGWVYIKKNLSDDAVRLFRELAAKNPNNASIRYHFAVALFQKGDRPNAKQECQAALKNNPSREDQAKIRELIAKLG